MGIKYTLWLSQDLIFPDVHVIELLAATLELISALFSMNLEKEVIFLTIILLVVGCCGMTDPMIHVCTTVGQCKYRIAAIGRSPLPHPTI